jgi:C4-dicarboxylate-specific signal transduction histidine kinase
LTPLHETLRPVETAANAARPKLLVADDEPDMLRFLKSQLTAHYQVLEAVDGQQAIEKASQFLPDIILLDMMMPEKDGLQACRELRERTSTHSIPIILLTARADEETKLAALAGALELLKETETQLVQTEKLASLGRMSAGIIHEINNPLNFATTGLYLLRDKAKYLATEQQEDYTDVLKDVEEGINRVKTIVSDLRSFSHNENEQVDEVDVAELVTASLRFLSHECKDRVQIEQKLPEHQTIRANKNKLIQVVVNLLQNSLDAFKQKSFDEEKPTIWIEGRLEKGTSRLTVRDNGEGIDPQNLDKIFDPFFTTKDVGEGMGLGLSISYRIVQEYEGRIAVKSERGKFCEFTLEFPARG